MWRDSLSALSAAFTVKKTYRQLHRADKLSVPHLRKS
jgi:hypothetical protein